MTFINVKFCTHAQCLLLLSNILQCSHVILCPIHGHYGTKATTMLRMAILKVKFVAPVNMTTHTQQAAHKNIFIDGVLLKKEPINLHQ